MNGDGGFTTGVDIFGKEEQEKLQTRAQRFGINSSEHKSMTDEQLQELHSSLGITVEDQIDTRFETIHMYGTQEMSTQDVFSYFGKYGPASIEWINDVSCNVVWHDKVSAARAFIALSKPIAGMPVIGECNPFKDKDDESELTNDSNKGRSILLIQNEVQMEEDKENGKGTEGMVNVSDINIPIPPGYWRLGFPHEKAEFILFRFAKRTDKKPFRAERFSEYYKKYGNPNYGGMTGLISESKRRKIKGFGSASPEKKPVEEKGNPWGNLAKNWNRDIQEELPRTFPRQDEVVIKIKMPYQTGPSKTLLERIGNNPQKRIHSDELSLDDDSDDKTKKSKIPRMKMYADEEEARIRKLKELKKVRLLEQIEEEITQRSKISDLRNRLGKRNVADKKKSDTSRPTYSKHNQSSSRSSSEISDEDEEDLHVQQKSKVAVVIRKPHKPSVASTVWSRLDVEKQKQNNIKIKVERTDSDSKDSSSESEDSEDSSEDDEDDEEKPAKTVERPGFKTIDLKSRLGLEKKEYKSPLRIEISNDRYKKEKP